MIFLVVGLGFGDEGKGSITDYLVRREKIGLVVRFNGGPQAAHHVVSPEGVRHCCAQFGAGVLVPGVRTLLAQEMLVEPLALLREAAALECKGVEGALGRLHIDERAVVVTPFHRALNRMRELVRGGDRHGTCGLGVGEARLDAESGALPTLRLGDLREAQRARRLLLQIQQVKIDHGEQLLDLHPESAEMRQLLNSLRERYLVDDLLAAYGAFHRAGLTICDPEEVRRLLRAEPRLVFEGAQGALLDRNRGFWPHVTPSRTGFEDALAILAEADLSFPVRKLGVTRTYATRHGRGPFVSEDPRLKARLPETDNGDDGWQGRFRCGSLDAVMLRYAVRSVGGVDGLALSHLDRLAGWPRVPLCVAYTAAGEGLKGSEEFFELAEDGRVQDLVIPKEVDRDHQGRLTKALGRCRPIVEEMPGWVEPTSDGVEAFLGRLEEACGVEVEIMSWGPSAPGKLRVSEILGTSSLGG